MCRLHTKKKKSKEVFIFMKRLHKFLLVLSIIPAVLLLSYGKQMYARGGFESLPDHSPLEGLRVDQDKMSINTGKDSFAFAVLGDMRWASSPRIAILRDAQEKSPLFMVNLGDVVFKARKDEWAYYIKELEQNWNRTTPYFHIPGWHSVNVRIDGRYPAFFGRYFGRTYYSVDIPRFSFIFLDTSSLTLPAEQGEWLSQRLAESSKKGKKAIIFTHCPPKSVEQGIDHSLTADATRRIAGIISGHDVAAIFSGHIHKTLSYTWEGIPVYITSLNNTSWHGLEPAEYLFVSISGEKITVQTIAVHRKAERGA